MTDEKRTEAHTHCWHRTGLTYTSYPAQWDEVCCHCGARERRHAKPPEPPPGCGPHHPDAQRTTISFAPSGAYTVTNKGTEFSVRAPDQEKP